MEISEKPFACNDKNCSMTFANEDHLNLHRKKHSMSFDLELPEKDGTALLGDQTPTPTSFFRNCEEVGLFQDLQNVNPFEETFKKALECTSTEEPKLGPLSLISNDDTLHTPHIFQEPVKDEIIVENHNLPIVTFESKPELSNVVNCNMRVQQSHENFKSKLKQALLKRDNQKITQNKSSSVIIAENIILVNNNNINATSTRRISNGNQKGRTISQQKSRPEAVREMNRAAQVRCRNKKKRIFDKMTTEYKSLQKENSELKIENAKLKQLNTDLYEIVKGLGGSEKVNFLDMLNYSLIQKNQSEAAENTLKKLPVLAPAYTVKNNLLLPPPLVYNVLPVNVVSSVTNSIDQFSTSVPTLSPEVKKRKSILMKKT